MPSIDLNFAGIDVNRRCSQSKLPSHLVQSRKYLDDLVPHPAHLLRILSKEPADLTKSLRIEVNAQSHVVS